MSAGLRSRGALRGNLWRRRGAAIAAALWQALVLLCASPAGAAEDAAFSAAFDAALAHDAEYRASRFELQAREQALPIARAGLLPNVAASYANSQVRGERDSLNTLGQDFSQRLDYRTPMWAVQLRAPLLDMQAFNRYESARAQVDGARYAFVGRGHELLERLGASYMQRLLSEQVLALAQAQVDAFRLQHEAAQRRYQGGEATRTDIADAAAGLAFARAQWLEALDQADQAERALARITGAAALPLRTLPAETPTVPLPPEDVEEWINIALAANPGLHTRLQLLEAARYDVQRQRAGHLPRVDLVASASDAQNESVSTLNQQVRQYSLGFQVNLPIFAGGAVDAGVTQAEAEVLRLQALVDNDRQALEVDIRQRHRLMQTGWVKAQALQQAVLAGEVALQGHERGLAAGVRTTVDVVDATRRLFAARRDHAQARCEALLARLRLQSLVGLALPQIVQDMDKYLTAPLPPRGTSANPR